MARKKRYVQGWKYSSCSVAIEMPPSLRELMRVDGLFGKDFVRDMCAGRKADYVAAVGEYGHGTFGPGYSAKSAVTRRFV